MNCDWALIVYIAALNLYEQYSILIVANESELQLFLN